MANEDRVVIYSVKTNGSPLRPNNWIERISSVLASFGSDNRLVYSECVKPCIIEGERCLVVARCLEDTNPAAFQFIMQFAESNQLRIQIDRRQGERALACSIPNQNVVNI